MNPEFVKINSIKIFGFWIYLMSDCVLFAALFTTFAVFSPAYVSMHNGNNIFNLNNVLIETFLLLISSFTFGLAMCSVNNNKKKSIITWLALTFILGLAFIALEIKEFYSLILDGHGPNQSAFLSSFFSLVGTHGLHVFFGLIWIMFMIAQIIMKGVPINKTALTLLGLFWHFLYIIWICIFTFVYLIGSF